MRSAAPVTQNHLSKPTDLMLQNATPLRKWAPWPPNFSHEHVFCTAPATENASLQILFKCPTPAIVFGNATKPSRFAHFWQGAQSLAPATRNKLWMSKSGPNVVCFVHFDFEMCFAPQRCALFRHLNFQKWSEAGVFCTFWLGNVLRATMACTFSTSQLPKWSENGVFFTFWLRNVLRATMACTFLTSQRPKVVRAWCALYILTWKCGSFLIAVNYIQRFITNRKGAVLFASDKVISLRAFTNVARFLWSLFSVSITLTKCCMQPHKSAFRWRWWTCCALVVLNSVCSWWKIKCDRLLCVNPGCIP